MGGRKDGAREGCEVVAPTPSTRVVDGETETEESLVPVEVEEEEIIHYSYYGKLAGHHGRLVRMLAVMLERWGLVCT